MATIDLVSDDSSTSSHSHRRQRRIRWDTYDSEGGDIFDRDRPRVKWGSVDSSLGLSMSQSGGGDGGSASASESDGVDIGGGASRDPTREGGRAFIDENSDDDPDDRSTAEDRKFIDNSEVSGDDDHAAVSETEFRARQREVENARRRKKGLTELSDESSSAGVSVNAPPSELDARPPPVSDDDYRKAITKENDRIARLNRIVDDEEQFEAELDVFRRRVRQRRRDRL